MKEINRGAEAVIYLENNTLIKERVTKSYRIPALDTTLRTTRTKREAKLLQKLHDLTPQLLHTGTTTLTMEYIQGNQLKDLLDQYDKKTRAHTMEQLGALVASMHDRDVTHGDLTTSNMLVTQGKIILIDFGLGNITQKIEDKAVDIHLFKQALESKHHTHHQELYESFLKGYAASKNAHATLQRLTLVEKRGRYKRKLGS